MGQVSIEPPAVAPADQTPAPPTPASTQPAATPRASTLPSAASVLQGILRDKPAEESLAPSQDQGSPIAQPVIAGVATESTARRPAARGIRSIIGRAGSRGIEKTGVMIFVFDSDGKQMTDPPMGVIPCRYLRALMEDKSDHGSTAVKFRISGEITEYRGKNYLYPKLVQVVQDLNQGIGAGGLTPDKTASHP